MREEILGGLDAVRRELEVVEAPFAFTFGQPQDLPAGAAAWPSAPTQRSCRPLVA